MLEVTYGFLLVFRRKDNWGNVKSPQPHLTTRNGWATTQAVPAKLRAGPHGQKEFLLTDTPPPTPPHPADILAPP